MAPKIPATDPDQHGGTAADPQLGSPTCQQGSFSASLISVPPLCWLILATSHSMRRFLLIDRLFLAQHGIHPRVSEEVESQPR